MRVSRQAGAEGEVGQARDATNAHVPGLPRDERGISLIEIVIASAIVLVAFMALFQMISSGSKGIKDNQLRSVATSEAIYGVEQVKSRQFTTISSTYSSTPSVTESVSREGVTFTRNTRYSKVTTADSTTNVDDYFVATVTVRWSTPPPTKTVTMSIYRMPE